MNLTSCLCRRPLFFNCGTTSGVNTKKNGTAFLLFREKTGILKVRNEVLFALNARVGESTDFHTVEPWPRFAVKFAIKRRNVLVWRKVDKRITKFLKIIFFKKKYKNYFKNSILNSILILFVFLISIQFKINQSKKYSI